MTFDLLLVGGGLQSALLALAVLRKAPNARLALLEAGERLGGNHTWSFFASDLSPFMREQVEPLVTHRWPGYSVAFPGLARRFSTPYASISSERLHEVLSQRLGAAPNAHLRLGCKAVTVERTSVLLETGERLEATHVIDARGPQLGSPAAQAYQKFVGIEVEGKVEPAAGSAPSLPCIMDARVPQLDGFRFVYTLPLSPTRWLVEDTYYSDSPTLDEPLLTARALDYAQDMGVSVRRTVRVEKGVLPLPLALTAPSRPSALHVGGYRGGWLHPTTGYSLPVAARLAELWAHAYPHSPAPEDADSLLGWRAEQERYFVLLNRLLFLACRPEQRWQTLERFHRLPEATVQRFYAMQTTLADRARILVGRPPRGIQLTKAVAELARAVGGA